MMKYIIIIVIALFLSGIVLLDIASVLSILDSINQLWEKIALLGCVLIGNAILIAAIAGQAEKDIDSL
jgi:hypothetical protein